jgi:hypothetical protein
MEKNITFYLPLDADSELKITVETREFNGISSDPKTITREPTVGELRKFKEMMVRDVPDFKWESGLSLFSNETEAEKPGIYDNGVCDGCGKTNTLVKEVNSPPVAVGLWFCLECLESSD